MLPRTKRSLVRVTPSQPSRSSSSSNSSSRKSQGGSSTSTAKNSKPTKTTSKTTSKTTTTKSTSKTISTAAAASNKDALNKIASTLKKQPQTEPSTTPATASSEIDELFAQAGEKSASRDKKGGDDHGSVEQEIYSQLASAKKRRTREPAVVPDPALEAFCNTRAGKVARQKTPEGYRIFSEEELKIGKGGKSPDCPFDCHCCF